MSDCIVDNRKFTPFLHGSSQHTSIYSAFDFAFHFNFQILEEFENMAEKKLYNPVLLLIQQHTITSVPSSRHQDPIHTTGLELSFCEFLWLSFLSTLEVEDRNMPFNLHWIFKNTLFMGSSGNHLGFCCLSTFQSTWGNLHILTLNLLTFPDISIPWQHPHLTGQPTRFP